MSNSVLFWDLAGYTTYHVLVVTPQPFTGKAGVEINDITECILLLGKALIEDVKLATFLYMKICSECTFTEYHCRLVKGH